ncbi:hypothetical protein FH5_02666 [Priestia endophytica]|nr:hypothetical protein FH5_02666 [Priestia endophytica]
MLTSRIPKRANPLKRSTVAILSSFIPVIFSLPYSFLS